MRKFICGLVGIALSVGVMLFFISTHRVTCTLIVYGGGTVTREGPCSLNLEAVSS